MPGILLGAEDTAGNMKLIRYVVWPATNYLKVLHNSKNGVGRRTPDLVDLI